MNSRKIMQYASKLYQEGRRKYGADVVWSGRTTSGEPVGALEIAMDMARQHTSEDDTIIAIATKTCDSIIEEHSIDIVYDNDSGAGRAIEYNLATMQSAKAWIEGEINNAIKDYGYHITATILSDVSGTLRARFREIIRITYDEDVNFEFYAKYGEEFEPEFNGQSRDSCDWLLSLFHSTGTALYTKFVQLRGIVS